PSQQPSYPRLEWHQTLAQLLPVELAGAEPIGEPGGLATPSPLRTVRDNLLSYGSSPGHLIAFSGVPLVMVPGMDYSAVVELVRAPHLSRDDVILVERLIDLQRQPAERTSVCLCLQQRLTLFRVRSHRDPLLRALLPGALATVHRRRSTSLRPFRRSGAC